MKRKLKKLKEKLDRGEVLYENIENMFKGWMCNFYKIMSKTQRKELILLYETLFNKKILIAHKK